MLLKDNYEDLDVGCTLVNTHLFNLEEEEMTDRWNGEMNTTHVPETEECGVSSKVFESGEALFHPKKLDVFPDPRKPVRMVIGIRSSLMTMVLLVFSCSCDDDTQSNSLLPVLGALLNLLLCSEEEEEEEHW